MTIQRYKWPILPAGSGPREDANGDVCFYTDHLAFLAEKEEVVRKISQLMCGNDIFPGDLVQYVKNEIDGRRLADEQIAALNNALNKEIEGWRKIHQEDIENNNQICKTLDAIRLDSAAVHKLADRQAEGIELLKENYKLLEADYEQKWGLSNRLQEQIVDLEKAVKVFQDDTLMRTTHIAHLEGQIAALTAKPVTLTNYHNEDITFTGKKKKGNVLVTTCGHDPLANAIPCATCALEQIAALEAERDDQKDTINNLTVRWGKAVREAAANARLQKREKVLIQRLQSHGDIETDKEEALRGKEVK